MAIRAPDGANKKSDVSDFSEVNRPCSYGLLWMRETSVGLVVSK